VFCHCLQACLLLEGRHKIVGPLGDAGVVDALVATLEHHSPYCVAAAAAALGLFGKKTVLGKTFLEGSGAIPGLIRVIEELAPPAGPEDVLDIFCTYAPEVTYLIVHVPVSLQ
jgi:hypothetical protein